MTSESEQAPPDEPRSADTNESASNEAAGEVEEIVATRRALEEANQHLLRVQAELENFRKRARREAELERKFAALPLVRDLLPAIDNLGRAIQSAENSQGSAGLLEGVKMVLHELHEVLARHECQPIEAEGQPFDPNLHEALGQQASAEHAPGEVVLVAQKGYQLHDRVVRPAQVFISTGPPASDQDH